MKNEKQNNNNCVITSNFKKLNPLGQFCINMGMIPTSYTEAMTYEEQILWLCNFYDTEILPVVNNNTEITKEAITKFNELSNYVHNYFNNLDVQDEINNKLDAMVNDGTLENILSNYVNIEKTYLTINDMINDNTIIANEKIRCLGYNTLNDGYGGHFIITNENSGIKLNNGLYANFINNIENNYYEEITCLRYRKYDTDYYITTIPLRDINNNTITPYVGVGENSNETPTKYAQNNNTNVTINASVSVLGSDNVFRDGSVISNGIIVRDYLFNGKPEYENMKNNFLYLALNNKRDYKTYPGKTTTPTQILAEGYTNAFLVYWQLINNFNLVDNSNTTDNENQNVSTTKAQRQAIGFDNNKTMYIVTTEGRSIDNSGMTSNEMATIMQELNCKDAYMLDGGGSTSLTFKGTKFNKSYDNNGTTDRYIKYTLNIKNNIINKNIADIYSWIGRLIMKFSQRFTEDSVKMLNLTELDCNNLIGKLIVGYGNRMKNTPNNSTSGYLINLANPINPNYITFNRQFYIEAYNNNIWTRQKNENGFTEWDIISKQKEIAYDFIYNSTIVGDNNTWIPLPVNNKRNNFTNIELINNNTFKINSSGYYNISGVITFAKNIAAQMNLSVVVYPASNPNEPARIGWYNLSPNENNKFYQMSFNASAYLSPNDVIKIEYNSNTTDSNDKIQRGNIHITQN